MTVYRDCGECHLAAVLLTKSTIRMTVYGCSSTKPFPKTKECVTLRFISLPCRLTSLWFRYVDAGSSNGSAKKRGRNGEEIKDEAYWERRRKNNEAAKRSRDARRAKEDEIAIRAAFLEQENLKLRFELANLKNETAKLRCMIYNS